MPTLSIFHTPAPASTRPAGAPRSGAAAPAREAPALALKPLVLGKLQAAAKSPPPAAAPTIDSRLLAILDAPLAPGETAMAGFARKEAELHAVLATLRAIDARALHARLSRPATSDLLATSFARLTSERRARLLTFLADARRREAIAAARR